MKKTLAFIGLIALISGCADISKDWSETVQVYISSETAEYIPILSDTAVEGMKMKEGAKGDWIVVHFQTIGGFTYEKGNEYILKAKKIHLANPPQDAPNVKYELIKILSKVPE